MPRKRSNLDCRNVHVGAQENALECLKEEAERLKRDRRALQHREKRLGNFIADVAFILFVWACPDTLLCQAYLAQNQGQADGKELTIADIEERYVSASIEHINAIQEKTNMLGNGS